MKISVFTPSHKAEFLPDLWNSIKDQDFSEWVVLLNGGAVYENADPRVKIFRDETGVDFVGYLKWQCCQHATGDILLEADQDDILAPHCVAEVRKAFEDPAVGFVYSNTIQAHMDWKPTQRFADGNGWKYRPITFQGHALDEYVAFEPTPSSVSRIWFAPNHVRAFRKDVYEKVGGYSRKMRVLDDLDLMCRLYLATEFKHIDKPLYLYRVHGQNAWLIHNAEIQNNVHRIHDQYIEAMAMKWSDSNGLRKLDLGGRMNAAKGFDTVDLKNADIICDLNERWPFEDGSVGVVRAFDVFEHLSDSIHTMSELYRVLAPGGYALIQVPTAEKGQGAWQDPTHRSFWCANSFLYYTNSNWSKFIDTPCRFQALRLYTTDLNQNNVAWTKCHLLCLKDGYRPCGLVEI